ncbi:hypothetical protein JCM11641_002621 [Rhodosporidiobolus odoratus]
MKPLFPSTPSIAVIATAPIPPDKDTRLASSSLKLKLRVYTDDEEIDAMQLAVSAIAGEVQSWLNKEMQNKDSLGLDCVGDAAVAESGVTFQMNAFSRSARSSALSMASAVAAKSQTPDLTHLDLAITFRSPRSELSGSSSQGPANPRSLLPSNNDLKLATQLVHPDSLHFTLTPLVDSALERVSKKLVIDFPLCFNSRWTGRLINDLPAQRSIASALSNILNLSGPATASFDEQGEAEAALLSKTLSSHISARNKARSTLRVPSPMPDESDAKATLRTALLLIAKETSTPDGWTASQAGAGARGGAKQIRSIKDPGKQKAKKRPRSRPEADREKGKKRRVSLHVSAKGDQADSQALSDFAAASAPVPDFDSASLDASMLAHEMDEYASDGDDGFEAGDGHELLARAPVDESFNDQYDQFEALY